MCGGSGAGCGGGGGGVGKVKAGQREGIVKAKVCVYGEGQGVCMVKGKAVYGEGKVDMEAGLSM